MNVSRETTEKLNLYLELLEKWNPRINLVSKSSVFEAWDRHILDSAQLFKLQQRQGAWLDLGSGGGFPGLVCAILSDSPRDFTLVESDGRKCAFLREVARVTETPVNILNHRVEALEPQQAATVSARALASLDALLSFAELHMSETGQALFPKGATWKNELAEAQRRWRFDFEAITSEGSAESVVLRIQGVSRV